MTEVYTTCDECGRNAYCELCEAETPDGYEVWYECADCRNKYSFDGDMEGVG